MCAKDVAGRVAGNYRLAACAPPGELNSPGERMPLQHVIKAREQMRDSLLGFISHV
jgi:hypothetical protein